MDAVGVGYVVGLSVAIEEDIKSTGSSACPVCPVSAAVPPYWSATTVSLLAVAGVSWSRPKRSPSSGSCAEGAKASPSALETETFSELPGWLGESSVWLGGDIQGDLGGSCTSGSGNRYLEATSGAQRPRGNADVDACEGKVFSRGA